MSKDYSENLALFSRTAPTYTEENDEQAEENPRNSEGEGHIQQTEDSDTTSLTESSDKAPGRAPATRGSSGKAPVEEPCAIPPFDQVLVK